MKRSGRFLRNGALPDIAAGVSRDPTVEPFSPQEVVAWLGIPLYEFPAWACAHLVSELASINVLARTSAIMRNPPRWCARSTTASQN
jgi:hypothetical protein